MLDKVVKVVTIHLFLAIATCRQWPIQQIDINNSFLHGYLKEDVYLSLPEGYTKGSQGQVFKLKRSLYGLKQASREWNLEYTSQIIKYGFTQSPHDFASLQKGLDPLFLLCSSMLTTC